MDRRDFLSALTLSGLGSLLPNRQLDSRKFPKPVARFGFLTDIHLPAQGRNEVVGSILQRIQNGFGKIDFLIFGGDNVFEADKGSQVSAIAQLDNWEDLVSRHVTVPTYSVLGNHDIWGWEGEDKDTHRLGKPLAMRAFRMPARYYAFEKYGWRFIFLDTVHRKTSGYYGSIDPIQLDWLSNQLKQNKSPTVITGHIPILSATALALLQTTRSGGSTLVSHSRILKNSSEVAELLRENAQVKLALSGHMHMTENLRFRSTQYLCGGAVSGGWWKGDFEGFPATMVLVELWENGFHTCRFLRTTTQKSLESANH